MQKHILSPQGFPASWASDWGEDKYGVWMAFTYNSIRQVFRWIVPGTFMMGSKSTEKGRDLNESYKSISITEGFWLADTQCTQILWQEIMGENHSKFKGNNLPVENVSWVEIQSFLSRINSLHPGLKTRLPKETEWEYSCRAGSTTPMNFQDKITLKIINYSGTWSRGGGMSGEYGAKARCKTVEVASMNFPNKWGLHEMHGNVREWCEDQWQEGKSLNRVVRGGSWSEGYKQARSAHRAWHNKNESKDFIGFRMALDYNPVKIKN